jgi:hypothetical protein
LVARTAKPIRFNSSIMEIPTRIKGQPLLELDDETMNSGAEGCVLFLFSNRDLRQQ